MDRGAASGADPLPRGMQESCITEKGAAGRRRICISDVHQGARCIKERYASKRDRSPGRAAEYEPPDTARPLVVPTRERPVAAKQFVFGCSALVRYSVVIRLFFSCRVRRTAVRQLLPAPSSPGIPPEVRRAA